MLRLQHIISEGTELEIIRELFRQYSDELGANLCFQSFNKELDNPLSKYSAPSGSLILAYWNNEAVGCIALQPLPEQGCCEMKRLYVQPAYRKHKIGGALVEAIEKDAMALGYTNMKLDTLQRLQAAIHLYQKHGFIVTNAYYPNPLEGVVYMEKQLA